LKMENAEFKKNHSHVVSVLDSDRKRCLDY